MEEKGRFDDSCVLPHLKTSLQGCHRATIFDKCEVHVYNVNSLIRRSFFQEHFDLCTSVNGMEKTTMFVQNNKSIDFENL